MIRQVNTAIPSRSFGRVCIINNMYGLLQYLLISSLEELEDTFFFFDDDVPDVLVSNYKNWTNETQRFSTSPNSDNFNIQVNTYENDE